MWFPIKVGVGEAETLIEEGFEVDYHGSLALSDLFSLKTEGL